MSRAGAGATLGAPAGRPSSGAAAAGSTSRSSWISWSSVPRQRYNLQRWCHNNSATSSIVMFVQIKDCHHSTPVQCPNESNDPINDMHGPPIHPTAAD